MLTPQRMHVRSPVVVLLRTELESGEIFGPESPNSVWESDTEFIKLKLATFSLMYHRVGNILRIRIGEFIIFFYNCVLFLPNLTSFYF